MSTRLQRAFFLPGLCFIGAAACGSNDGNSSSDAGDAFARHLTFEVDATPQVSPLPAGVGTGPQVVDLPQDSAPTVVEPGDDLSFSVGWQGGNIASVNLACSDRRHFEVPVPLASGLVEGIAEVPASVDLQVCDGLAPSCHRFECLQQVVTSEGSVSLARARDVVLDCGGTGSCETGSGTVQPGDPCDETEECIPGSVCFNKYCVGAGTLRVSLAFEVDSDFDLHVMTPSGAEIYFVNRTADAGTLDVDQCISPCGTEPHAENVVFDGSVLPGAYEVWVVNYDGRNAGNFTIQVAGDVTEAFQGTLPATSGEESDHFMFTL